MTNLPKAGHVTGDLRNLFEAAIEAVMSDDPTVDDDGVSIPAVDIFGRLWNCTDIMPRSVQDSVRVALDDDQFYPATYAQAARRLKPWASA